MKKTIFLSKQGLFYKILNIFFQCLIILPITLIISYFLSKIMSEPNEQQLIFMVVFLCLNTIWIIRNSLIVVTENQIVIRDILGKKRIIETKDISSLKIINSKEYRQILLNTTKESPLITNCFALLIPIGNVIYFKNSHNRNVIIGAWNSKRLLNLLVVNNDEEKLSFNSSSNTNNIKKYIVKMPLKYHFINYFKHFYQTIIFPIVIVAFLWIVFHLADFTLSKLCLGLMFIVISLLKYISTIIIVVNERIKTVKLNLFTVQDQNVINYDCIENLRFIGKNENRNITNTKHKLVCTPNSKNPTQDAVCFDLKDETILLSVYNTKSLFDVLNK